MPEHELGHYTGRLILMPLKDGRRMRVIEEFGFMEADGLHWPVPPHSTVDGASIPQALWTLIGGPWEGKYRDASVVHDYYCAVRSADWRSVHRLFYRAMLVSGVSVRRAKVMYVAVYFGGPRWDDMVVENVRLGPPAVPTRPASKDDKLFRVSYDPTTVALSEMIYRNGMSFFDDFLHFTADTNSEITLQLDKLSEMVERDDPPLRSLEAAIDTVVGFFPGVNSAPRGISVGRLASLD